MYLQKVSHQIQQPLDCQKLGWKGLKVVAVGSLATVSAEVKFLFPSIGATVPAPRHYLHFAFLAQHKKYQAQSGLPQELKAGKNMFS